MNKLTSLILVSLLTVSSAHTLDAFSFKSYVPFATDKKETKKKAKKQDSMVTAKNVAIGASTACAAAGILYVAKNRGLAITEMLRQPTTMERISKATIQAWEKSDPVKYGAITLVILGLYKGHQLRQTVYFQKAQQTFGDFYKSIDFKQLGALLLSAQAAMKTIKESAPLEGTSGVLTFLAKVFHISN